MNKLLLRACLYSKDISCLLGPNTLGIFWSRRTWTYLATHTFQVKLVRHFFHISLCNIRKIWFVIFRDVTYIILWYLSFATLKLVQNATFLCFWLGLSLLSVACVLGTLGTFCILWQLWTGVLFGGLIAACSRARWCIIFTWELRYFPAVCEWKVYWMLGSNKACIWSCSYMGTSIIVVS